MTSQPLRVLRTALILAVAIAVPAAAQQHVPLTDQEIASLVEHRLSEQDIRGVTVTVRNGEVTLSGTVRSLWAKEEAIEEARKAHDVRAVVSTLTIMRPEDDRTVGEAIADRIRRYVFFSIFDDVDVEVAGGVATLMGSVTMPYKAQAIVKLASRVDGVQQVVDELDVLPLSDFDDQIRYAAALRIYNDPLFWNYAVQVNPPIHIVVRNGRVTLTGVVVSEVERRKAEVIAREIFGVLSVDNKLRLNGGARPAASQAGPR
jgi:hyperosmotically inducible protein